MLAFMRGEEQVICHDIAYKPLETAFVIVESDHGFMLLHNRYRKLWELPGGMMEPGETPRECAIRECQEESNQALSDVQFVGLAKILMKKNAYRSADAISFSAVYHAFLQMENIAPFVDNAEMAALRWWRPGEPIDDMCKASLEMIREHRST